MQYNVEGHIGNILSNNTGAAKALARILNYNQPDIVTFCELQDNGVSATTAGVIDWVTNNIPYFGSKTGVTFWVDMGGTDGYEQEGSISRYPITNSFTYSDGCCGYGNLRGMESFRVNLAGTNALEVFHVHLKADSSGCTQRQTEAAVDANNIANWASGHSFPYIFTGDCNEDENPFNSECVTNSTYHPITTLRVDGGLLEYLPKTLNGGTLTWSSTSQSIRFDYALPATNRISLTSNSTVVCITTGIVFNSSTWGSLYTSVIPGSSSTDSRTASDHLCVQVTYWFPTSATNFNVTPSGGYASGGSQGGPFSPSSMTYTLTNTDTMPMFWSIIKTSSWLTISKLATNLSLAAGASTNITAYITNSVANSLLNGTYTDTINFSNVATGVSFSRPVTLTVSPTPPNADFSGSPTSGTGTLAVTFTDTSTGSITNRFWDFGDGKTTNLTTEGISHNYTAGTYSVSLTVSGPLGTSTNTKPAYITVYTPPAILNVEAAVLSDGSGTPAPTSAVVVLVADTGSNGFTPPQSGFSLSPGAVWGGDDTVVGLWDLRDTQICAGMDGALCGQTIITYTNGVTQGANVQLYWFPSLTLASNTLGSTSYGFYTDTNSPPLDGGDVWKIPAPGTNVTLRFYTASVGGSNPDTTGWATSSTSAELTPFQTWQIQYFGDTNNPNAAASADPDGDGENNLAEFLTGTDPTNNASTFRIQSIVPEGNNLRITWTTGIGRTNALELCAGDVNGNYATNGFTDIFTVTNTVSSITNYLDGSAMTNAPVRYYRVRLVP